MKGAIAAENGISKRTLYNHLPSLLVNVSIAQDLVRNDPAIATFAKQAARKQE